MKKLTFAILAFAALTLASCGNKAQQATEEVAQDSTKSFEQTQIEEGIKMHLDSLAAQIDDKDFASINNIAKSGSLKLTDEEKKVKPTYLLAPADANNLTTASQKYAALAMLDIDKALAEVYGMDVAEYDKAVAKLTADVNDPALKKMDETEGTFQQKHKVLYEEMDKEGRINFYWVGTAAGTVENLFIMSQNVDKFLDSYSDEQIANITFRLVCILDALDRLSVYDPQIPGIAEALEPLKVLNATTKDEFKKQLLSAKDNIEKSRKSFLE